MKLVFSIKNICPSCSAKAEEGIKKIEGVEGAVISFLSQKLTVEVQDNADAEQITKKIIKACKKAEPDCEIE